MYRYSIGRVIFKRCLGALGLLFLMCPVVLTQQQSSGLTDNGLTAAFSSTYAGGYPIKGIDTVNLYNGQVSLNLPLGRIGGRGSAGYAPTISLTRTFLLRPYQFWSSGNQWSEPKYKLISERYNDSYNYSNFQPGLLPAVIIGRRTRDRNPNPSPPTSTDCTTLTKLYLRMPGGEVELRDSVTHGQPRYNPNPNIPPLNRGREWHSVDGSGTLFVSDSDIQDESCVDTSIPAMNGINMVFPTGYLMLRDGTRYRFVQGYPVWMRDRNGNTVTFTGPIGGQQVTDSIARTYTLSAGSNQGITYKDQNGINQTVTVIAGNLGSALRSDFASGGVKTLHTLIPIGQLESPNALFDPNVTKTVRLPNGLEYHFFYTDWGELARIELPTGGIIEYDYAGGPVTGTIQVHRFVTAKRIYDAPGHLQSRQTFEYAFPYPGPVTTVASVKTYDSTNVLVRNERHTFIGTVRSDFNNTGWYELFDNGRESSLEILDASNNVLRRVDHQWQSLDLIGAPTTAPSSSSPNATNFECALTAVTTSLSDTNQIKKSTFKYDGIGNTTDTYDFDFGSAGSGSTGALLRRAHTDFNQDPAYVQSSGSYILALPTRQWISADANGANKVSETEFEYDVYSNVPRHWFLISRPDISGSCMKLDDSAITCLQASDENYIRRGNLTQVKAYYDIANLSAILISSQYDVAGNVVKSIDGQGNVTTLEYLDRFGVPDNEARSNSVPSELSSAGRFSYAFPTTVTNPLGHIQYSQYNYYLGKPVNIENANGTTSSTLYDFLGRPKQVVRGANQSPTVKSQTTFEYDDITRKVTTTSDLTNFNDNKLKTETLYDGLGRTIESRTYETTTSFIATRMEYDGLDRAFKVSNPFRAGDDDIWTTTLFDTLGRPVSVTTHDGAVVALAYSGNQVLVTDQSSRQRLSTTDALGRLTDIWEITSSDPATEAISFPYHPEVAAGYRTRYGYDAVDNLLNVTQRIGTTGTIQSRAFFYDSLNRLTSATNPESGTISYEYDNNGNLKKKTDARIPAVITNYDYDELNRLKHRTYSDGTPAVSYNYDDAGVANSKGRLTGTTSNVSSYSYTSYDALGRVLGGHQSTDGQVYLMGYTYDLAGNIRTQTYPSGRVVVTEYDAAGRMAGIKNQANEVFYAGALATDETNRIQYSAHGAVSQMRFGNGLWEHTNFNSRLQVIQIGLGTAATNSSVLQLDYGYGTTANNGNLLSHSIASPGPTLNQSYTYDALNRLETASENAGTSWKQKFLYDRYGNRRIDSNPANTSSDLVGPNPVLSEVNNRIAPQAGEQYQYDGGGNLTRGREGQTYTFDAENKMTSFNGGASQGGADYSYDGDGRRVKKVFGNITTVFVYDILGQLVAEYSNAPPESSGTQYFTSDHLGSPRLKTDSSGVVESRHDYHPFGEEVGLRGGRSQQNGYVDDGVRQKFTQKERDIETNLDFFESRYFSSVQGRFTSPDPLIASARRQTPQSWNRYAYVINNPLNYIDPSGEAWIRRLSDGAVGWDADVHNEEELRKLYGPGHQIIDGRQGVVRHTYAGSGFIVGHLYTFNADGSVTHHGVYLPPFQRLSSQYGDEMALAVLKLYFAAALSGATGGTSALSIALGTAGTASNLLLAEDAPDPQTAAMAAGITISPLDDDWITKGAHIKVDGVELKALPGKDGQIVFKQVFSSTPQKRVAAAIAKAEAAFTDPAFTERFARTVGRGVTHFGKGSAKARAKSGELRFLLKILRKGK